MEIAAYLAGAPPAHFAFLAVAAALAGIAGLAFSFHFLKRSRVIEDTPTSRVHAAAQGYVELEGRATLMPGPPIICPLSRSPCLWWSFTIEHKETHYDSRGRRRTNWETVESETSDDLFWLRDGTGQCVIDPAGASVIPSLRRRWYGSTRRPGGAPMAGRGLLMAAFHDYRYTEELIWMGSPLYALGAFRTQGQVLDPLDERAELRDLLKKWKSDPAMMKLLDANKDGQVDQREWEAARRMALDRIRAQEVQQAAAPDLHLLHQPRDGRPFILSAVPQSQLVRRYRLRSVGSLVAGVGAFAALLWGLSLRGLV